MFALARHRWLLFCVLLVLLTPLALLVAGCSSTGRVTLNSMRPAAVTFPPNVERLVIVERTAENSRSQRLESILTGELPDEDKAGTQALLAELTRRIGYSGRFDTVVAQDRFPGLSLTSAFPEPLSWDDVSWICDEYEADAALVLEIYDTDFVVTRGTRVRKADGSKKKTLEFTAEGVAHVTVGLRVYDPVRQQFVDEQVFVRSNSWETHGLTIRDALLGLIDKSEATRQLAAQVGSLYAQRITPTPIRLTRAFRSSYKKVPAVERGTRFAEVGDWKQAMAAWKSGLATADEKGAGYLTYNIALAHEVLGDFAEARTWAERSYTQYGYREAREYVSYLDARRNNEALAEQQYQ